MPDDVKQLQIANVQKLLYCIRHVLSVTCPKTPQFRNLKEEIGGLFDVLLDP